jgi:hypothetical protein
MVRYLNAIGEMVALVHQYRRPGGSIGGKGRPDPKVLIHNGVEYRADPDDMSP